METRLTETDVGANIGYMQLFTVMNTLFCKKIQQRRDIYEWMENKAGMDAENSGCLVWRTFVLSVVGKCLSLH